MFQVLPYLAQYKINVKNEVLAGLTTALALVPEVVAFALLAHISPLVGIGSAFIICLITSVFGGRPGMISGAAGSVAVVIVSLVVQHGPEYLFAAVVLMGLLQVTIGLLRLGKFIRLVPQPVVYGFVNGLAVIIFMAQLDQFKVRDAAGTEQWLAGTPLLLMLGLVGLTMGIVYFLPKLTKAVPASLVAIIVVSALVILGGLDTKSVGDIASIAGGLPTFHVPQVPLAWHTLGIVFPYALIMALVGLTESLLTLTVVDEMTDTRGRGNQDCVAQGLANITSGFFGGMGGCAMIGQTMVNLESRGRGRLSGVVAAVALALFVVVGSSLIERLPLAALVGVMFMVVIGTFEWASLRILRRMPRADVLVMLVVTLVTAISQNLALAVLLGVVISALVFAWENAKRIRARKYLDETGVRHYEIYGPLFFGSVQAFSEKFDTAGDPQQIVIDFQESRVADMSAIEALHKLTERYHRLGKTVHLRHLSPDCRRLLANADSIIEVNILEDPLYTVAGANQMY
ncbi:SulP family inorganic anion transporter [Microvirga sp. STR05]|uniref:SulP family inorganic anion transporter n=1 Tax=Hymenobacter duratus TaxID=2771356 RepID=A0ABR8JER6_9BACT|nr:SulP family inorganic anion transporter [Hymenobacter duratus]MBD2715356.1 SulP family inorganic anion transporter [Hymenobacter duratus]MBR7950263.1 SulP family inorganic anion transporter [Microvirga sp. STR05]